MADESLVAEIVRLTQEKKSRAAIAQELGVTEYRVWATQRDAGLLKSGSPEEELNNLIDRSLRQTKSDDAVIKRVKTRMTPAQHEWATYVGLADLVQSRRERQAVIAEWEREEELKRRPRA